MIRSPIRDFSELSLVAANAVPLVGVLFWDWSVFDTMLLYWLENVVIGILNIVKILTLPVPIVTGSSLPDKRAIWAVSGMFVTGRLFLSAFFAVHYGMFMMVHGIFVFALFGDKNAAFKHLGGFLPFNTIATLLHDAWNIEGLAWPIASLVASHVISYLYNFWIKGERNRISSKELMNAPYNRMIVLHLTIIFGGWLVMLTGQAIGALVLLVLIKTGFDLALHRRSHKTPGQVVVEGN